MANTKIDPREERIAKICAEINKSSYGGEEHNAVTWLGSRDTIPMPRWSSGCPALNVVLGGGWPKGRQIEIFGPESGGKTTLCLHAIAEHQKAYEDEDIALIDSEYAFDEIYAQSIGVDTRLVIVNQPESGIQALNVMNMLIERGVGLLIVDSVAALIPKEEMGEELGNTTMGSQARMMSQGLRRLNTEAGKRGTTIIWTNQVRSKIGVMYGDPTTTPAGMALKHYASVRIQIKKIGNVKEKVGGEDVVVSTKVRAEAKKNKTAPPFRQAEFVISFGHGIDTIAAILDECIERGIVVKKGSWFSMDSEQIGQGRMGVMSIMRENKELVDKMSKALEASQKSGVPLPKRVAVKAEDTEDGDSFSSPGDIEAEVTEVDEV